MAYGYIADFHVGYPSELLVVFMRKVVFVFVVVWNCWEENGLIVVFSTQIHYLKGKPCILCSRLPFRRTEFTLLTCLVLRNQPLSPDCWD